MSRPCAQCLPKCAFQLPLIWGRGRQKECPPQSTGGSRVGQRNPNCPPLPAPSFPQTPGVWTPPCTNRASRRRLLACRCGVAGGLAEARPASPPPFSSQFRQPLPPPSCGKLLFCSGLTRMKGKGLPFVPHPMPLIRGGGGENIDVRGMRARELAGGGGNRWPAGRPLWEPLQLLGRPLCNQQEVGKPVGREELVGGGQLGAQGEQPTGNAQHPQVSGSQARHGATSSPLAGVRPPELQRGFPSLTRRGTPKRRAFLLPEKLALCSAAQRWPPAQRPALPPERVQCEATKRGARGQARPGEATTGPRAGVRGACSACRRGG